MDDDTRVILYIDDDADYRYAVRQMLEAEGYEVLEADDGEEGLRVFRDRHPDLVIVDLMMEEVDAGVNFLREVKAGGADTPVYLMSSVGDTLTMTTNAGELGFSGVFQKPVAREHLTTVLRSRLRRRAGAGG
jgi:DNA-binding response OmpR family regulator